ncbi:MAG: hypothetical protein COT06_04130 [Syntrophobacteraceae bacterium CG07_land_8_20_14_0_80_61_8]|nr:MAG: hypothetical protein COT06_04130 [Syntrophobacteraceae bacterium CG07_land_8_20_14_0_80_61_8]
MRLNIAEVGAMSGGDWMVGFLPAALVALMLVGGWAPSAALAGELEMGRVGPVVPFYATPTQADLCGTPVPLDRQDVWERFDREFTIVVYSHAQVYLWLKRLERYGPWMQQQLKQSGLPQDLLYLAVAESDLQHMARSPANAAGIWQFIPGTGSRYGLKTGSQMDERYDFDKATQGALQYLSDLHRMFQNWPLAIAAYNCGENRVKQELAIQGVSDYYSLDLPNETERYVPRILAIKTVLANPERYGYYLPKDAGYPMHDLDRVQASLPGPMPMSRVADACTMTLSDFRVKNPAYLQNEVPAGEHIFRVPKGSGERVSRSLRQLAAECRTVGFVTEAPEVGKAAAPAAVKVASKAASKANPKAAPKARVHKVEKGDTLSKIGRLYEVSVAELKHWNNLKSETVKPGQVLKVSSH